MTTADSARSLEEQIHQWRSYLRRRQAIHAVDVAELEDHLREEVGGLMRTGLATDEAFLVAVKRMGALDTLSREFAREHSERLWKQLVVSSSEAAGEQQSTHGILALVLAVVAAALVKLPILFGITPEHHEGFYLRNGFFFVLPLLTGFFVWKRQLSARTAAMLGGLFAVACLFANVYPFQSQGHTQALTAMHLPIVLWLLVGIAYAGERWKQVAGRMDFLRFSGELFIYYVLIALGGGVFMGFMECYLRRSA